MTRMFGDSLVWGLRLFVLFVVSVRPASAQETVCGDPAQILEALNRDYGEEPVWTGTSGGGRGHHHG